MRSDAPSTQTLTNVLVEPGLPERLLQRKVALEVIQGPDLGARAVMDGQRLVLGSHPRCQLQLTDPTVSRLHAELQVQGDSLVLLDMGSTNGTSANGIRVREALLPEQTDLWVGHTRVRVTWLDEQVEQPLSSGAAFGLLLGRAAGMRALFARLQRAAQSEVTVLLEGETGTGKELAAQAIHDASSRARGPFVVVDCGVLAGPLIESELFGHERGAFTGAHQQRRGALELASGGTVFLDEVGELPLELQPRLLRVLERKEIKRVGGDRMISVDVRVVAATNRNLRRMVAQGAFRDDLYYRLAVICERIPPLRERTGDIPLLVNRFLEQGAARDFFVSEEMLARLQQRAWSGNVRELRNVVERAVALGVGRSAETLVPEVEPVDEQALRSALTPYLTLQYKLARGKLLDLFEQSYLERLLEREAGNLTHSARSAGIDRVYLLRLLDKHGMRRSQR